MDLEYIEEGVDYDEPIDTYFEYDIDIERAIYRSFGRIMDDDVQAML